MRRAKREKRPILPPKPNQKGCGCCACLSGAGVHVEVANRPGLSMLRYRVGTYGTFLDAMIRRLTIPLAGDTTGDLANYSLHALTTREQDDPAIALLDAWAIVGDVLTFYEERIANEGFLRTASERRSILELGRLVGYKLKPGVSASVYLAYTVDESAKTVIPAGSKAQSIPGADEQPQMFETSDDLQARGAWNAIKPRQSKPQEITLDNVLSLESVWIKGTSARIDVADPMLFVFHSGDTRMYAMRRAAKSAIDTENDRSEIALEPIRLFYKNLYAAVKAELAAEASKEASKAQAVAAPLPPAPGEGAIHEASIVVPPAKQPRSLALTTIMEQVLLGTSRAELQIIADRLLGDSDPFYAVVTGEETDVVLSPAGAGWSVGKIVKQLAAPRAVAPANMWQLSQSPKMLLSRGSDLLPRLAAAFIPAASLTLHAAIANASTGDVPYADFESLHVLKRRAAVFGYNAPTTLFEERAGIDNLPTPGAVAEKDNVVSLDTTAEAIQTNSYVVVQRHDSLNDLIVSPSVEGSALIPPTLVRTVRYVETGPRTAYAISSKSTTLTLNDRWADFSKYDSQSNAQLSVVRKATVLAESRKLDLARQPIIQPVGRALPQGSATDEGPTRIDLDVVIEGLQPGRWVIVSGERVDIPGTAGIVASELAMIAGVEIHPIAGAGGKPYSTLLLASEGLKYEYKRSTATIYGNVVHATHGETRNEILGAGDASRSLRTFSLHQTPLTFVSAPTVAGVVSTLAVRVNDVLWHEDDTFFGHGAVDRTFVTKTADDGKVSVIFGNGRAGSRVPTGSDNVRAVYRSGIGKPGNVRSGQIATAISRPLGVKNVVNPLAASGGADPESRDDARRNIPVSLQAMGRIVSVQDYADFARTFAGINKAIAIAISDGLRRVVHLTVGGEGDIEIDVQSDLYRNLVEALRAFGDPYQPFVVAPREKVVIAGSARVRVDPDYLWEKVAPKIRAKLLHVFSYDRRQFAQPIFPAEVIAAIQGVEGVSYVDLDALGGISQDDVLDLKDESGGFGTPNIDGTKPIVPRFARLGETDLLPAQIAYMPPALAELFTLTEIPDEH